MLSAAVEITKELKIRVPYAVFASQSKMLLLYPELLNFWNLRFRSGTDFHFVLVRLLRRKAVPLYIPQIDDVSPRR